MQTRGSWWNAGMQECRVGMGWDADGCSGTVVFYASVAQYYSTSFFPCLENVASFV